jgi:hypothetical protein
MPGKLMVVLAPSDFDGFFEKIGAPVAVCQDHPARDGDCKKFGREFLPPWAELSGSVEQFVDKKHRELGGARDGRWFV